MAVAILVRSLPHGTARHSYASGTSSSAISLSHGLGPSLRGASVVATVAVAMVMAMAIMAAAAAATREVALPGRGGAMTVCDSDEVGVYAADNAGADATAE